MLSLSLSNLKSYIAPPQYPIHPSRLLPDQALSTSADMVRSIPCQTISLVIANAPSAGYPWQPQICPTTPTGPATHQQDLENQPPAVSLPAPISMLESWSWIAKQPPSVEIGRNPSSRTSKPVAKRKKKRCTSKHHWSTPYMTRSSLWGMRWCDKASATANFYKERHSYSWHNGPPSLHHGHTYHDTAVHLAEDSSAPLATGYLNLVCGVWRQALPPTSGTALFSRWSDAFLLRKEVGQGCSDDKDERQRVLSFCFHSGCFCIMDHTTSPIGHVVTQSRRSGSCLPHGVSVMPHRLQKTRRYRWKWHDTLAS